MLSIVTTPHAAKPIRPALNTQRVAGQRRVSHSPSVTRNHALMMAAGMYNEINTEIVSMNAPARPGPDNTHMAADQIDRLMTTCWRRSQPAINATASRPRNTAFVG